MFEPSREKKRGIAKVQKALEEGLNDLRPLWWPIIVAQTTFFTAIEIAQFLNVDAAWFVPLVLGTGGTTVALYIYLSYKWDLHNVKGRLNSHITGNFASPTTAINQLINTRQQAVQSKAIAENWEISYTEDVLEEVTAESLEEFREGLDTEEWGEFFD